MKYIKQSVVPLKENFKVIKLWRLKLDTNLGSSVKILVGYFIVGSVTINGKGKTCFEKLKKKKMKYVKFSASQCVVRGEPTGKEGIEFSEHNTYIIQNVLD